MSSGASDSSHLDATGSRVTTMSETVYSASQVARKLGVSGGMVRRYAMALEALTGEPIPQHPRDGRQFTQNHVDTLVSARRFVAGRQGMSVETGLRLALGLAELPTAVDRPASTDFGNLAGVEALKTALSEYMGPLLTELRTLSDSNARLSDEVAALRSELAEAKTLPLDVTPERIDRAMQVEMLEGQDKRDRDGLLVQCARWLEGIVRRN